jgi:hypothetical protein
MKISKTGRATAYDENAELGCNAAEIIRAFGKEAVTPTWPFRP